MTDPRIFRAQELVGRLVDGDYAARAAASQAGDEVDALLVGLNMLAEELSAASEQEKRLAQIQRFLAAMAAGRRPPALLTADRGDTLDAVMVGLNMLAEELEGAIERQATFRSQALYDTLTSLPNRTLLTDRLEMQFARAHRDAKRVAILFIDLDGFKLLNDRLGHAVGDAVLMEVSDRLRSVVRETDTVARYGGDEFVVAAVVTELEDGDGIMQQIVQALQPEFLSLDEAASVSASVGVAFFPDHATDLAELIRLADTDMYEQKRRRLRRGGDPG